VDEIIKYHSDSIFTSFNPNERHHIEWDKLWDMDIVDSSEWEIPIYCSKGFTVPRYSRSLNTPLFLMI